MGQRYERIEQINWYIKLLGSAKRIGCLEGLWMISYCKLSRMTLIYIIILALFSRYTEHYYLWKFGFLILFGCLCISDIFRKELKRILVNIYFVFIIAIIFMNAILSENNIFLFSNLKLLAWPVLFLVTISAIYLSAPHAMNHFVDKLFLPLNIMLIANLIIILIQCSGTPLFIKSSWLTLNSYYEDLCSGLFGYNGTHELSMFLIFMNAYDIYFLTRLKKNRNILLIYIVIVDLFIVYISTQNDNIAMFLLLPLFIVAYLVLSEYLKKEKINALISKFGKYIVMLLLLCIVALMIPRIREFIEEYVLIRVKMVFDVTNKRYTINGSNERLAIVIDALSNKDGWILGKGIGSSSYGGGDFWGYNHFGLSSIGTLIMTGGIWYYLFYTLFFMKTMIKMVKPKRKFPEVVCFLLIVFLTIYTIFYTSFVTTIWFVLFFLILGAARNKMEYKNSIDIGKKMKHE